MPYSRQSKIEKVVLYLRPTTINTSLTTSPNPTYQITHHLKHIDLHSRAGKCFVSLLVRPKAIACGSGLKFCCGLFFSFFFLPRNLRAPSADRHEILHDAPKYVRFYNPGPKFWGSLPKNFLGPKTRKIWPDFGRLRSSAANFFGTDDQDIQNW